MSEEFQELMPDDDTIRIAKIHRRKRIVRKGRARQERLRALLRLVLTIVLLMAIYYTAKSPQWYMSKNAFTYAAPETIRVINNKIVPTAEIYTILRHNEVAQKPIYLMKTSELKKQIMQLAPVDNVYIRRYGFPARIQIIIREKIPAITISPDLKVQPVAFLTQDGKTIGREYLPLNPEYKTILVLSYDNKWNETKVQEIQKIVKYVETYSGEPVEYLDLRNPKNIFIKIKTVNIRLGEPDENIFARIERIPAVLPQVKLVGSKVKYLDLSWEKVNYLKLE
jgi:hypothetical protein